MAAAAAAAAKTAPLPTRSTQNLSTVPVAPQRKKRTAPRPPSQNSIPENHENSTVDSDGFKKPSIPMALPRKHFHMSFPNLSSTHNNNNSNNDTKTMQHDEFNNNISNNNENKSRLNSSSTLKYSAEVHHHSSTTAINMHKLDKSPSPPAAERPVTMSFLREDETTHRETLLKESPMRQSTPFLHHSRTSSDSSEVLNGNCGGPEPVPRKRTVIGKKYNFCYQ